MTKRILMVLVASVVVAIAVAPVASANPASSQYDQPTITTPVSTPAPSTPVSTPASNTPVSTPAVSNPAPKVHGVTASVTTSKPTSKPASTPTQVTKVSTSDTLPFTGLDLGLFLVIGGVAVASGLGLRRVAARRSPDR